jgi:hypothetical protein
MNDWLETLRAHVEWQLGDQVTSVTTGTRDHGGWHGIYIRTQNGWRHAVAVQPDDPPEEVAQALQKAIDERRGRQGMC